ncbi:ABC transporter permease [Oceanobacillus sp. J11TS1]|uniref:ABC transporter permease n=1 Tax=Oceanobacillus sp. J11TS1 TaxID=2807191 RepID=UPI001B056AE4|nr:ABC transporter permease [Oceanobacillus sp. J11TS1]GIO23643.1 ABC transporter permease [Oceanobacillus sp. J11TS1]
MLISLFGAFESGIIYAIMALGVYLSFRILDFPDLTVDGSFVTGAAVGAIAIINGVPPIIASIMAGAAGFIAGCLTGFLHTKGKINALLAGIIMMTALYSINLRILGQPTASMLNESTLFTQLKSLPSTWAIVLVMILVILFIKFLIDYYLKTEVGLALRATGNNKIMIRSLSANTDFLIITGMGVSNALVAFSGGLIAQYGGFADVNMGIGMIIIGLASVIIGESLFGTKTIVRATFAVIGGAIIYRIFVTMALRVDFLDTGDMKLITAILVITALVAPRMINARKEKKRKIRKRSELMQRKAGEA